MLGMPRARNDNVALMPASSLAGTRHLAKTFGVSRPLTAAWALPTAARGWPLARPWLACGCKSGATFSRSRRSQDVARVAPVSALAEGATRDREARVLHLGGPLAPRDFRAVADVPAEDAHVRLILAMLPEHGYKRIPRGFCGFQFSRDSGARGCQDQRWPS